MLSKQSQIVHNKIFLPTAEDTLLTTGKMLHRRDEWHAQAMHGDAKQEIRFGWRKLLGFPGHLAGILLPGRPNFKEDSGLLDVCYTIL